MSDEPMPEICKEVTVEPTVAELAEQKRLEQITRKLIRDNSDAGFGTHAGYIAISALDNVNDRPYIAE